MIGGLVGIGLLALLLVLGVRWVLRRMARTSIYDMRLVAEKTGRSAYRARLRLFVIETGEESNQSNVRDAALFPTFPFLSTTSTGDHIRTHPAVCYQHWRQATLHKRERTSTHKALLDRLTAAYRQYHLAAGGYFVPHSLSQAKAQRLLAQQIWFARILLRLGVSAFDVHSHLLSVADVAVLWHLPQASDLAELPLLERGRARTFLVPQELTTGEWLAHRLFNVTQGIHCRSLSLPRCCATICWR